MRTIGVLWCALAAAGCAGGASVSRGAPPDRADLVLRGGTIYTMSPLEPRAEALAIRAGRVEAVGTAAEVAEWIGPETRVIELEGRAVLPGLVDGHCHLYGLGRALEQLDLRGVASAEEAAARVAEAARGRPAGEWIEGRGWDQNLWSPPEFPTREALDRAAPGYPVALRRVDGHAVWASSAALAAAGIDDRTPDPPGGRIVRDAAGRPTGVLVDNAADLILAKAPAPSDTARERMILAAVDRAVAAGLTGVHEMGIDAETVETYRRLAAAGRLKLRVYAFLGVDSQGQAEAARRAVARRAPDVDRAGTAFFVLRGVKLFADGALGSRGAALLEPYADDPGNSGLLLATSEELAEAAKLLASAGWQLAVHAIGDRANRMVLDAFEPFAGRDLRFRIEHAQIVSPADLPRFARLGVIAAMQPTHATSDMPWAEARLGAARLAGAYAWRSILAAGGHLVGGSDFPVEEVSPLLGLYAAMTRQDAEGQPPGGWLPGERLELEEALDAYTRGAAYASFSEQHRGRLAAGFVADVTVLDRDPAGPTDLLAAQVDLTIVGGRIIYDRTSDR